MNYSVATHRMTCVTNYLKRIFSYSGVLLWNFLPESIRAIRSIGQIKKEINRAFDSHSAIKVSIVGNGLCTSVYYKPTDSHSYLYSSSHPSHVKNFIPFSEFLGLRRLCSDDSDFFHKSESMCQLFEKHDYPVSVVQAGHHRAQLIDRQSSLHIIS